MRGVPPLRNSQTKLWDLIGTVGSDELRKFAASSRQLACSLKVGWQRAYDQVAARWPDLDLIELVRHRPQQGIMAGLLVIAILLGAVDLAMKSSSASGSKAEPTRAVAPKLQDRPPFELAAPAPLLHQSLGAKPPNRTSRLRKSSTCSNGHPAGGLVRVPKETLESATEPAAQTHRRDSIIFQSETAAGTGFSSPSYKKACQVIGERGAIKGGNIQESGATATEPKPMRFEIIGYN